MTSYVHQPSASVHGDSDCDCLEQALDLAETLLMDAPDYSLDDQIVKSKELLKLVQLLNAAAETANGKGEFVEYRVMVVDSSEKPYIVNHRSRWEVEESSNSQSFWDGASYYAEQMPDRIMWLETRTATDWEPVR